jgi:ATP-dependent helicase/nuclease subunit A
MRFLELALEIESGRYPSIPRFIASLRELHRYAQETLEEPPSQQGLAGVRLMTIHAAKGLEAPVVFVANAAADTRARDRGLRALLEWPVEAARPRHLHVVGKQDALDDLSQAALARLEIAEQREETNLLYVALTRAKQWLFVSGVAPRRERDNGAPRRGWYGFIEERLRAARDDGRAQAVGLQIDERRNADGDGPPNTFGVLTQGERPQRMTPTPPEPAPSIAVDPALTRPLASTTSAAARPSAIEHEATPAARRRGTILHRMLQGLSEGEASADILARVRREWPGASGIEELIDEAQRVVAAAELRAFFDPQLFDAAHNELPLLYERDGLPVYGIVDRVVVRPTEIVVLDYKTHAGIEPHEIAALAAAYFAQLRAYAAGAARIWPGRRVRALLVFTGCVGVVEVPLS